MCPTLKFYLCWGFQILLVSSHLFQIKTWHHWTQLHSGNACQLVFFSNPPLLFLLSMYETQSATLVSSLYFFHWNEKIIQAVHLSNTFHHEFTIVLPFSIPRSSYLFFPTIVKLTSCVTWLKEISFNGLLFSL